MNFHEVREDLMLMKELRGHYSRLVKGVKAWFIVDDRNKLFMLAGGLPAPLFEPSLLISTHV